MFHTYIPVYTVVTAPSTAHYRHHACMFDIYSPTVCDFKHALNEMGDVTKHGDEVEVISDSEGG